MGAERLTPEVVPAKLPTFPIMHVTLDDDYPSAHVQCCCGEKFVVDCYTGENTVCINRGSQAICPNCFGIAGTSLVEYIDSLLILHNALGGMSASLEGARPMLRGWQAAQAMKVGALVQHAAMEQLIASKQEAEREILEVVDSDVPLHDVVGTIMALVRSKPSRPERPVPPVWKMDDYRGNPDVDPTAPHVLFPSLAEIPPSTADEYRDGVHVDPVGEPPFIGEVTKP